MAVDDKDTDERQSRLDAMIEEFRVAQHRRLVKRGVDLWNRTETAQAAALAKPPPPEKLD